MSFINLASIWQCIRNWYVSISVPEQNYIYSSWDNLKIFPRLFICVRWGLYKYKQQLHKCCTLNNYLIRWQAYNFRFMNISVFGCFYFLVGFVYKICNKLKAISFSHLWIEFHHTYMCIYVILFLVVIHRYYVHFYSTIHQSTNWTLCNQSFIFVSHATLIISIEWIEFYMKENSNGCFFLSPGTISNKSNSHAWRNNWKRKKMYLYLFLKVSN